MRRRQINCRDTALPSPVYHRSLQPELISLVGLAIKYLQDYLTKNKEYGKNKHKLALTVINNHIFTNNLLILVENIKITVKNLANYSAIR